ncbi:MAG: hypothetical protein OEZ52_06970 [Candidatus Aminicenantes bacterium]|nr:hypothetical protein [Candidatus Aminicenantes bacterium]
MIKAKTNTTKTADNFLVLCGHYEGLDGRLAELTHKPAFFDQVDIRAHYFKPRRKGRSQKGEKEIVA